MNTTDASSYKNLSATAQIKGAPGIIYGIIVNSNASGTLKLWDALTATGNILINTYTFTTATSQVIMFPVGINFYTGLFATIGGTADITILYV